jgi:hypothetical protein
MLEKKEDALMRAIFTFTTMKGGVGLIRPIDLLSMIPYNIEFKASDLEPILSVLEMDDYIDTVETDKKGEMFYCITLHKKGQAYKRSLELEKRNKRSKIIFKIAMTLLGIAITTIITKFILPLIFNN